MEKLLSGLNIFKVVKQTQNNSSKKLLFKSYKNNGKMGILIRTKSSLWKCYNCRNNLRNTRVNSKEEF